MFGIPRRGLGGLACVLFMAAGTSAARAEGDCPPLVPLPGYRAPAAESETRDYIANDFKVAKNDTNEIRSVAGRRCLQHYAPEDGARPLSDVEIQRSYRDQLKTLGATVTHTDANNTFAKLESGGEETWFHVYSQAIEINVVVLTARGHRQRWHAAAPGDYGLLGHMPNYVAGTPEKRDFGAYAFKFKDGDETRSVTIEGAWHAVAYSLKAGVAPNSDLDIQTSYRNALRTLSGEIMFTDENNTYARFENIEGDDSLTFGVAERPVWVHVHSQETSIKVAIVKEPKFQAGAQPTDANALKSSLNKDGRVTVHLDFDFNRDGLKPVSDPVMAQIAKLLTDDPALTLSVEVHTDNVGDHGYNMQLSADRAVMIIEVLGRLGIAEDRLKGVGYGPDRPVGDNSTMQGRARNQRVELVKL